MLLLVDAANGFNNLSKLSMLWTVRHRCPRLATYAFNCYRHVKRLICRDAGGEPIIILSEEGVTQGDPLAMVLYGIALRDPAGGVPRGATALVRRRRGDARPAR